MELTKENETLEVKSGREFLSEKECVGWLQQEEITNDFLFGVRQRIKAVMEQEQSGNAEGKFQGGKQVYLFNEIAEIFYNIMMLKPRKFRNISRGRMEIVMRQKGKLQKN